MNAALRVHVAQQAIAPETPASELVQLGAQIGALWAVERVRETLGAQIAHHDGEYRRLTSGKPTYGDVARAETHRLILEALRAEEAQLVPLARSLQW